MDDKLDLKKFKPVDFVGQIANSLEEAILDGSLTMGQQLVETKLAKNFNSSRQPIREAFRVLEKKGLVTIVQRKGAFVRKITQKDLENYFPLRGLLDGFAGKLAYKNITNEDINNLHIALEGMADSAVNKDFRAYMNFHSDFHGIVNNASGNQILIEFLTSMLMTHSWITLSSLEYFKRQYKQSIQYHKKIVKEFERKRFSEKEIEQLFSEHVLISLDFFRKSWVD